MPEGATPSKSAEPPILPSSPEGVTWVRATTIDERHEAVLKLLGNSGALRLAPGSASPEHRQVLLFAVSELEHLARECPATGDSSARDALLADAARYRELADGHPALPAALRPRAAPDRVQRPESP